MKNKICSKCKKIKLIKEFYKHIGYSNSYCKRCHKEYYKEYNEELKNREKIPYPKKRKCNKCGKIKLAKEFSKNRTRKNGLSANCRECDSNYSKKYTQKNKEKINKKRRKYYQKHKNEKAKRCKEYCQKMASRKDNEIPYPKRKKCGRCGKIKLMKEFRKNRVKRSGLCGYCKKCQKEYNQEHKEKINKYHKNKRENDISFRIACNLRAGVRRVLSLRNLKKLDHSIKLIGCTVEFLIKHIEKQFQKDMTWNNYGNKENNWCIDHIKPCAAFDLAKENEQRKCFNYKNLQPLWNKDNWTKGDLYNGKRTRKK